MCRKSHSEKKEIDRETRIADMNIDGMPWHVRSFADRFKRGNRIRPLKTDMGDRNDPPLTRKETWSLVLNAAAAALVIGLIFAGAVFLFILFCIYVWFK